MTGPGEQDPDRIAQLQRQLADAEAQIAAVKAQLGGDGAPVGYGGGAPPYDAPAEVARLADPPRQVPFSFRLAAFAWSWYEGFAVFMGLVAPIALWGFFPELIPAGLILAIATILYIRGGKAVRRLALVKWGKVATVTNADELSRGTYYSGMTYSNMWLTQAHGWDVTRRMYSGPGSKTRIDYTIDGATGSFVLRGLPYAGGVVLAHPQHPSIALCVNQFVYDVKPDAAGEMAGGLRTATWVGIPFTVAMELALVVGAVYSTSYFWL